MIELKLTDTKGKSSKVVIGISLDLYLSGLHLGIVKAQATPISRKLGEKKETRGASALFTRNARGGWEK